MALFNRNLTTSVLEQEMYVAPSGMEAAIVDVFATELNGATQTVNFKVYDQYDVVKGFFSLALTANSTSKLNSKIFLESNDKLIVYSSVNTASVFISGSEDVKSVTSPPPEWEYSGIYNSSLTYNMNNIVTASDNNLYQAVTSVPISTPPPNGAYWVKFLIKGIDGLDGDLTTRYLYDMYTRDSKWRIKGYIGDDRLTLVSPTRLSVDINGDVYKIGTSIEIDTREEASWDDVSATDYRIAANRAGKDIYVYACTPTITGSVEPDFILSVNNTYPDGYSALDSRKIGGFHCVCVSYGDITLASGTPHTLTGFLQGDIIPNSVWDLLFRAVSNNNVGQTFDPGTNRWVDIYLPSVSGGELVSVYGGTLATGDSAIKFHPNKFKDWFNRVGKQMPTEGEFFSFSQQSNQGTVRNPASVPATTGGHVDSAGRRMVSGIGCEDCCGVLWQWGRDRSSNVGTAYVNNWDANDSADVRGQSYGPANVVFLGGSAAATPAVCGSRSSTWHYGPLFLYAAYGSRGVSELRHII